MRKTLGFQETRVWQLLSFVFKPEKQTVITSSRLAGMSQIIQSPKDFTEDQIVQEMTKLQEFNILMSSFFCSNCQVEQVLKEKCCSIQLQGPNVFRHLSWELQGRYQGQVKTNKSTGWGRTRKCAIQFFLFPTLHSNNQYLD